MSHAHLELKDVSFQVSGRQIIHNITWQIHESRVGIVGRNGSGKSTLARLMGGLLTPTSGQVLVEGLNVAKNRKAAISNVGMVFQNPDHQIIFPTVIEELSFGLESIEGSKSKAHAKAMRILHAFGKADWADRLVNGLSQGQKHLLCLLSVLAMQPKLIILDEPFTGPDHATVKILNRFLAALEQSIVLITHDPKSIANFDRVIWLDEGKIHMDGSPKDVLEAFECEMNRLGDLDVDFELAH